MLDVIVTAAVQATMVSAIYALVAIGFTMIFGVGGVLNLAHGALIMSGAYIYTVLVSSGLYSGLTLHPLIGFVAAVGGVALLSLALYEILVRWIEDNVVVTFLSTVLIAVALTELLVHYFGTTNIYISFPIDGRLSLGVFDISLSYHEFLGFVLSWVAIGLLWYYVTQTDDGRSILATSMSERGAHLTGVNIPMVRAKTWLIAGSLAGLAGIFLGFREGVTPLMWLNPLAIAFIVVVIGGIGSIKGSLAGAYVIGFLEQATVELLGTGFRGIPSLLLLVMFLLVRPEGLFGREFVHD